MLTPSSQTGRTLVAIVKEKNKGKRRGREERAQDIALDGETSLPIQARSKVTTATNSAVHAHRSQAPSSAIAALAVAHSAQAQWRSPMLAPSSQTGRTLVAIVKEKIRVREEEEKNARKIEYWMRRQVSPSKRARRSRLQLTALFTLIGRKLPLRPSLHSLCSFRSGTMAFADAHAIVANRQNVS